jgi:hypothetical protein
MTFVLPPAATFKNVIAESGIAPENTRAQVNETPPAGTTIALCLFRRL